MIDVPQPFIVEEKEELVAADRTAHGGAELVLHQGRFDPGPDKRTIGVQHCVAQIVVYNAVKAVGAAAGGRVDDRAGGAPVLGAEVIGLNLELLHRIGRGDDGFIGITLVRGLVSVVVEAVELKIVDHGIHAVDVVRSVAAGAGQYLEQRLAHARNQRREICIGTAVERQIHYLPGLYSLTPVAGIRFEYGGRAGYLN